MAEGDIRLGGLYDKGLIVEVNDSGFLAGRIVLDKDYAEGEELRIVIFVNNYKEKEEHPDFTVLKGRPRKEEAPKKAFTPNKFKKPGPQAPAQNKPAPPKQFKPGVKPSRFGKK